MTQIFNTTITGNVGNLSNAGSRINQSSLITSNQMGWQTLEKGLSDLGLDEKQIKAITPDLEEIKQIENPEEKKMAFGNILEKIKSQMGDIVSDIFIKFIKDYAGI